ncbi:hypothetical protein BH09PSE1_BH09PSE1_20770 [soil metagenome]
MIPALAAAFALFQTPVCAAPPDAALLWANPATRFVFVGETHGTTETPAAFAELVCEASATRPVVIAVEIPETLQAELDAWMASDGGASARDRLLGQAWWAVERADGRSSAAMLAMLERVRLLKAEGRDLTLRGYQPARQRPPGFDQSYYENNMAGLLIEAAYARPDALVLALGGSLHARKTFSERHGFFFAAGHLGVRNIRSVRTAYQGGRTWACFGESACGDSDMGRGDTDAALRGVVLGPVDDGAYDGLLAVGPTTASGPARSAP